jgi:hypothetical protein
MDATPMTGKPLLTAFLLGTIVFAIPAYMLLDRSPAVETVIHLEPQFVFPGQRAEAVWTVKVLRPNCYGYVHRKMIDSGRQEFGFSSVDSVIHGAVGSIGLYRYDWTIPSGMSPGPAVLRRNTERWCNPLQRWLWPMHEVHEAKFEVTNPP